MKHHKYYNTIWTERDQEFWRDGAKSGFAIGIDISSILIVSGIIVISELKEAKKSKD